MIFLSTYYALRLKMQTSINIIIFFKFSITIFPIHIYLFLLFFLSLNNNSIRSIKIVPIYPTSIEVVKWSQRTRSKFHGLLLTITQLQTQNHRKPKSPRSPVSCHPSSINIRKSRETDSNKINFPVT